MHQLFLKPVTNLFPAKYAPASVKRFLAKGRMNPPVPTPPGFRGRLVYDYDKCIGCGLCVKVCPASALELYAEKDGRKKVRHFVSRCTFCSQCNDICPVSAYRMSDEFLLADTDKYSKRLVLKGKEFGESSAAQK